MKIRLNIEWLEMVLLTSGLALLVVALVSMRGLDLYQATVAAFLLIVLGGSRMACKGTTVAVHLNWTARNGLHWKVISMRDGRETFHMIASNHTEAQWLRGEWLEAFKRAGDKC